MGIRKINESTLTAIADAIRSKTGGSALINPEDMADAILSIGGESGLPSEYQQVSYIQTSGSEFIQTGFRPKQSSRVVLDWELIDALSDANSTIMGTVDGTGRQTGNWQIRYGGMVGLGSLTSFTSIGQIANGTIDMSYGTVLVNGENYTASTGSYAQPNYGLILGGLLTAGALNVNATIAMRIREFYAYTSSSDTEPIKYLIPCYKKANGEIGMYDLVGRTFHANAGTGTFTKGVDVN